MKHLKHHGSDLLQASGLKVIPTKLLTEGFRTCVIGSGYHPAWQLCFVVFATYLKAFFQPYPRQRGRSNRSDIALPIHRACHFKINVTFK